jgi:hypothetical protein
MEYLVSINFNIHNKCNELTFVISNRKEVVDLTLGIAKIGDIVFQVGDVEVTRLAYCNPKRTKDLKANPGAVLSYSPGAECIAGC